MADTKPAAASASAPKSDPPKAEQKTDESKPVVQAGTDTGKGLADELKAHHAARTTVPGRDGVDARLDNRTPDAFEQRTFGPDDPKPQHVDGPDLAGQVEHTRDVLAERAKNRKG